jgi:septal ring factor EnvC (AmiA/AmiB activator)
VEYENRKQYGTVNLANFIKAYQNNQQVQFDFPGGKSYKLTKQWVDMLADYYNTLETNNDKAQLVYDVLTDYNKTIRLLNELAQSKLFEKKSSEQSNNPEFKSTKLARLKTQARAKYPAASSDLEAMAADFVDSQEDDQREFERVNDTNKKQDELLKQITAINRQQDQEIDGLDSDNNNLQQNLQQLRAVNTELAKKLASMAKRKPKEKEKEKTTATTSATSTSTAPTTTGGWVPPSAADTRPDWTTAAPALPQAGIPTATPAMVGG